MTPEAAWRAVVLELLSAWPGRFDEVMAAAYIHSLQGRGAADPHAVLRELRAYSGEHPPAAPTLAALVLREGQGDAPSFLAVVTFVAQTIAARTKPGDDALSEYVAFVGENLHEAPARWVADLGMPALRAVPDPRYGLEKGQMIRLRDHEQAYREHVEGWEADPARGRGLRAAIEHDRRAGLPEARIYQLRAVPEIGPGA